MTMEVLHSTPATEIRPLALSEISSRIEARSIKAHGVERLKAKIERLGFQVDKPVRVMTNTTTTLFDPAHAEILEEAAEYLASSDATPEPGSKLQELDAEADDLARLMERGGGDHAAHQDD